MFNKNKLASIVFATALTCSPSFAFDKNDNYINQKTFDTIVNSTYQVRTDQKTICYNYKTGKTHTHKSASGGTGILLKDKETNNLYILTNSHVSPGLGERNVRHKGTVNCTPWEIKTTVKGLKTEFVKRDAIADLALLKIKGHLPGAYDGHVSSKTHLGDYVLALGYPGGARNAMIPAHGRVAEVKKGYRGHKNNALLLYLSINAGNSGSGVFAMEHGAPVLVGLINAHPIRRTRVPGLYQRIEHIAIATPGAKIEKLLTGTALEDDYIPLTISNEKLTKVTRQVRNELLQAK